MKKAWLFLLLASLLLVDWAVPSAALAQEPTNTPIYCTPTFTPTSIFPTVIFPTIDLSTPTAGTPPPPGSTDTPTPVITSSPTPSATPTHTITPTTAPEYCGGSITPTALATSTPSYTYTYINDDSPQITYSGTWTDDASSGEYNNDRHKSATTGGYAEVSFTGTQIYMYALKSIYRGIADIYLDGVLVGSVNQYQTNQQFQVLQYTSPVLPNTNHTLKIVITGTSSGGYVDVSVDYWRVRSGETMPPAGAITCINNQGSCTSDGTHAIATYNGHSSSLDEYFALSPTGSPIQITIKITAAHQEWYSTSQNRVNDTLWVTQMVTGNLYVQNSWIYSEGGQVATGYGTHYGYYTTTANSGDNRLRIYTVGAPDWPISDSVFSYTVEVWAYVQCQLVTPTPISTPIGGCVVDPSTYDISSDFVDFGHIVITQGDCYTIMPNLTINFPESLITSTWEWLSGTSTPPDWIPEQLGIPGVELCVNYADMNLKFLDFDIFAAMVWVLGFVCIAIIWRQINS